MTGIAGAIVNAASVVVAGVIGCMMGSAIPKRISDTIMKGMGLAVMYIGISGALGGKQILVTIISIALGALIGEAVDIDLRLEHLSGWVEEKLSRGKSGSIAQGMCTGTLLFCVGAMAVVGSLQAGLTGDCSTIFTKSLIDFISAIVLSSTLGIGICGRTPVSVSGHDHRFRGRAVSPPQRFCDSRDELHRVASHLRSRAEHDRCDKGKGRKLSACDIPAYRDLPALRMAVGVAVILKFIDIFRMHRHGLYDSIIKKRM